MGSNEMIVGENLDIMGSTGMIVISDDESIGLVGCDR